ncbi:MAG TPA: VOC family protein [Chitinophagales bacterium]
MKNIITWFEIPATDVARAAKFYETVIQRKVNVMELGGITHAFFDHESGEVSGAIVKEEGLVPSKMGVLMYFDTDGKLDEYIARVEPAGGKIETARRLIAPEIGSMATFIDTEGNRMAFYESVKK